MEHRGNCTHGGHLGLIGGEPAVAGRVLIWGPRSFMTLSPTKDCPILTMFFKHLGEIIQIMGECKLRGLSKGGRIEFM